MAHIPHYGTPGYSNNPTSSANHTSHSSPGGRNHLNKQGALSSAPQSPLALALRRNLPAAPESPLLKPAPAQQHHTPQVSKMMMAMKEKMTIMPNRHLILYDYAYEEDGDNDLLLPDLKASGLGWSTSLER